MNDFIFNNSPYIFKLIDTYYKSYELKNGQDVTVSYSNISTQNPDDISLKKMINIKFYSDISPDKYASDGFIDNWGKLKSIEIYNKNNNELIYTVNTDDHILLVANGLFCDFTIYPNLYRYQLKFSEEKSSKSLANNDNGENDE